MNETLFRSSYSPIIYESKDCAAGLFDLNYGVLGLSAGVPAFLGNLEVTIEETTKYIGGQDKYKEGDVFILNDCYMTGAHLSDVTLISPIFYKGLLVGFTANRAHWVDIGSKDSGYPMDSTSIYQEGIRIPPIKIMENGVLKEDIADFICRNNRFYRAARGDLNAQIASCKTGEARYIALIERFGLETLMRSTQDIFNQSDAMEREVIRTIPDGVYTADGCLDNDGTIKDQPIYVKVTVKVAGDEMVIDLTGSNKAAVGSTNCGIAQTISACRMAYKMIISPMSSVSGGSFRALDVIAPRGSIFYAEEPTACAWYFTSLGLMIDLVAKAMQEAIPDMVGAAHYGDSMVVYFSGNDPRDNNKPYLYVEATVGGWGAHAGSDGESALINTLNGVYKNIPVEVFESNYPVKINSFKFRQDSGGPGKFRGGNGIIKEYEAVYDDTNLFLWFERSKTPGWGINGGQDGMPPDVVVKGNGQDVHMLKTNCYPLKKGQIVMAHTGGGGGFGNAFERDYELVQEDFNEGYISEKQAKEKYGVVFAPDGKVDIEASEKLRAS